MCIPFFAAAIDLPDRKREFVLQNKGYLTISQKCAITSNANNDEWSILYLVIIFI